MDPTSGFVMVSREYGSSKFVTVRTLEGVFDTRNYEAPATADEEDYGANAIATINGALAAADGNHISMKNSQLDMEMDVLPNWTSTAGFTIYGGGALFQVGPRVDTNLQLNMAINSVNATQLGTAEIGYLVQLKEGGDYSLVTKQYHQASLIVTKAIDQISFMRGRLGSLERNTLDTNLNQLSITSENLTSAESAIRDADFAYETSRLARDQILVNAGTTVLTLANQSTQSVLRLLGGG
jgi:flagellin